MLTKFELRALSLKKLKIVDSISPKSNQEEAILLC
jgi:hypothetical protein